MIPSETFEQWVSVLGERITHALQRSGTLEEALGRVEQECHREFGYSHEALQSRLKALEEAAELFRQRLQRVEYLQKAAVRFGRKLWYAGPSHDAPNWNGLKSFLRDELGRPEEAIDRLDAESTAVVSLLDNPEDEKFSTRGLVVGYVQSGKTANMAAVVAKAADTPYKFFLILSGMTDALRNQTQERLERDVCNIAPERWYRWTSVDAEDRKGDFNHPAVDGFAIDGRNQFAVLKKNAGVLRRFLAKLKNTDAATLRATPFLIIDDECDQASVNSARYEKAMTAINKLIRQILERLPRAAYVGYTATPFANVLIDPRMPEDLYPRNFIYAMEQPPRYFGAEKLFGRAALEGEHSDNDRGFDMLRTIHQDEIRDLRPAPGGKSAFSFKVTESLRQAISYFLLTVAAREARGQADEHCTMLVHTSVLNSVHRSTEKAIRPFLSELTRLLQEGDQALLDALASQWEEEQERVLPESFDLEPLPFEELRPLLASVAATIEVKVENWSSDNRISYSTVGRRYLVIGGNVLARGLTLEGLTVSFFLRSSSQYDTLMQMGRWFGYRSGYEDLPRVWLEEDVQDSFFDLATVEAEIRRDIARYAQDETTPLDFAVRIRKIPGMLITARAKMRNVAEVEIGYAGSHQQTTRFFRKNLEWLTDNWAAGGELLRGLSVQRAKGARVARGVEGGRIVTFLRSYKVHPSHGQLDSTLLIDYIEKQALDTWNVVVVEPDSGKESEQVLGELGRVRLVRRSALVGAAEDACIKALMSKGDLLADLPTVPDPRPTDDWESHKKARDGQPPLLLLYPIERRSDPRQIGGKDPTRVPLDAVHDVLGLALCFPGDHARAQVYVAARLDPEDAVEIPEDEDDLPQDIKPA